jgi:hypothetical protein
LFVPTFPLCPEAGQLEVENCLHGSSSNFGTNETTWTSQVHLKRLEIMENIAQDFNAALPDAIDFHLEFEELLDQGVSKTTLSGALARHSIYKCMSCPVHGEDLRDLRKHLRANRSHLYGVETLRSQKDDFVQRLLARHPILADANIQQFCDVHKHYQKFSKSAKDEYKELLILSMQQIYFGGR